MQAADVTTLDRTALEQRLIELAALRAAIDAEIIAITRRLSELADTEPLSPEAVLTGTARFTNREARHTLQRAAVLDTLPRFETSLAAGDINIAHVDVLARAAARLEPEHRPLLADHEQHLLLIARHATPDSFERTVARTTAQLGADDGLQRLERQRRATSLKHWTNRDTGMHHIHAELDPENAMRFIGALEARVETLFRTATPDTCPTDSRRNDHLNALALIDLVAPERTASGAGRTEICVHIDERTLRDGLHDTSHVDTGSHLDIPIETIRRLACTADIIPIVLNSAGVPIDIGRAQRLATKHQRRALRAMYPTCAVPGCNVHGRHCTPHHITYWRNGGTTDLHNLLPLCTKHHHLAHEGGWTFHLDTDRRLTITLPNGLTMTNGPPNVNAA